MLEYELLDSVPIGIFVLNREHHVLFWNSVLEDWTGIAKDAIIGHPVVEFFPRLNDPQYMRRLDGIFEGGPPTIFSSQLHQYVIPVKNLDGSMRVQQTTVRAIQHDGEFHALFAIQDVSDLYHQIKAYRTEIQERRKTQQALLESEERYRNLSEMISDFAFSFTQQDDGRFACDWVTDAFTYVTGYPVETLRTLDDWVKIIYVEDVFLFWRTFRTLLTAWADEGVEHRIITQTGATRHIQMFLRAHVDPENKRILQIYGAARDVTSQKDAEYRLRESESRFRQIAENTDVVVYVGDVATQSILYVSPQYDVIMGQPRRRLIQDPLTFLGGVDASEREAVRHVLTFGGNTEPERGGIAFNFTRHDKQVVLHLETFPIQDGNHTTSRYIVLIEDITKERQAQEQELALAIEREQIQLLSAFITDATHEFRTPLSIINSSSYLLGRVKDDEKRAYHVSLIQQQVTVLSELVDALVLMAGLDKPDVHDNEQVNLNHVVHLVYDQMLTHVQKKGIHMSLDLTDEDVIVRGRSNYLWQAVLAIVDNALQYTDKGGAITIRTTRINHNVQVEVTDTGIGIEANDLPYIFDRFYRADKAHTTPGFGLGLAITKKIVEQHGGKIHVESQANHGSVFILTFPLVSLEYK